jgi:putative transposase
VSVHAANLSDTKSAGEIMLRTKEKYTSIKAFSGDAAYRGTAVAFANETLNISEKIKDTWAVLPKRWVVERTFAWLNNFRRLAKDFEILTVTSENIIRIAMIKLTLAKCV